MPQGKCLKSAVGRHDCDIANADMGRLLPAEQHDLSKFCWANESGVAEHFAVLLEADPHLLMNGRADQTRRHVDDPHVVLGNPTFISPAELAEIVLFCWQQPPHICIRDIAVMPTDCAF